MIVRTEEQAEKLYQEWLIWEHPWLREYTDEYFEDFKKDTDHIFLQSNDWNPTIYECKLCWTKIYSSYPKEFSKCNCVTNFIAIDQSRDYIKSIGKKEQFIRLWTSNDIE